MKLKNFLEKVDKDRMVIVMITAYGMTFETKHSVGYYLDHGNALKDSEVSAIYTKDDTLCVRLED